MIRQFAVFFSIVALAGPTVAIGQNNQPSAKQRDQIDEGLRALERQIEELASRKKPEVSRHLSDVQIHAKAAEWILRHDEFFKKDYARQTLDVIEAGKKRVAAVGNGTFVPKKVPGSLVRGYRSRIDGSVQPYAVSLPAGYDESRLWPLHLKLHGRQKTLNEVSFFDKHSGKPPADDQTWIQLDVYGRGNNAYRWAGESDVFEALDAVRRYYRVDEDRITLHGFSMGGAGAWHLGMHHPARWSSVGPGAGFVDFYKYQKQTEQLPHYQHQTLGIYDSIDYVLNAANVPVCTYGGENDSQLVASTSMVEAANRLGVDIKLLVGPGMGHKFHPDSFREFMTFHQIQSEAGRKKYLERPAIRFATRTLKYNKCDWLEIDELIAHYEPATVQADRKTDGTLEITTDNIAVLHVARDLADEVTLDGIRLPLVSAANGLLPSVYYSRESGDWKLMSYRESRTFQNNPHVHKRHNLQGPIDDAFTQPFICVRGTGTAWSKPMADWATFSLNRFEAEFDKWMRAKITIIDDNSVTDEHVANYNLVLFGDPGSNTLIERIYGHLPVDWQRHTFAVSGRSFDTASHGIALIFPNPLNPSRYVAINSGHTFHEDAFRASNSWLFPRLGDIAVQKFDRNGKGGYRETTVWAELFDSEWKLPVD